MDRQNAPNPKIIAVDGPAASGKGTLARALAAHFGFDYLDTGLLYRAVAYYGKIVPLITSSDRQDALDAVKLLLPQLSSVAEGLNSSHLGEPALRNEATGAAASFIAKIPEIRAVLFNFQVNFAHNPPGGIGATLDGRDIGSVICPGAAVKLFVTASIEVRAQRRFVELYQQGHKIVYAAVLDDMTKRDTQDRERAVAPLVQTKDAFLIDNTCLTPDHALQAAISYAQKCGLVAILR